MQMIRHDLRLIQMCVREMFRYPAPAFVHDLAYVVQFHHGILSQARDPPE